VSVAALPCSACAATQHCDGGRRSYLVVVGRSAWARGDVTVGDIVIEERDHIDVQHVGDGAKLDGAEPLPAELCGSEICSGDMGEFSEMFDRHADAAAQTVQTSTDVLIDC
jgi:hypothetical protein